MLTYFRVFFLIVFFTSCGRDVKVSHSYYYWRSVFKTDAEITSKLKGVSELYVKFFDVIWKNDQAIPVSIIHWQVKPRIDIIPVVYGCDHVANTLEHAIMHAGTDKELQAKIVYLRALVEKAQAFVATSNISPDEYWQLSEEEQKKIDAKSEKLVKEKYTKYRQFFIDKVADSEYKRMIISECEDIRKLSK